MPNSLNRCPFHTKVDGIMEFDMIDPRARENPFPYYDWLRQDESNRVYKLTHEESFYVVHKHEDVKKVLTNNTDFINKILPTQTSPFFALMDGEDHLRIRNIATHILNPKNELFSLYEIDRFICDQTKKLARKNYVELFREWANPIPLTTLCLIFGLDYNTESIDKLHSHAITINRALFVLGGTGPRRSDKPNFKEKITIAFSIIKNAGGIYRLYKVLGKGGFNEIKEMFGQKKSSFETPRPDFKQIPKAIFPLLDLMLLFASNLKSDAPKSQAISYLQASIASNKISFAEAIMACAFIMFAGYETTTSLLSNCVNHLAHNPQEFQDLKDNPDKIENFIDEALRIYTPVGRFLRRTNKDVQISNTLIPKGSIVILMLGAANTDPNVFENPYQFNQERKNQHQSLSFGKGVHFCSGMSLARHQIRVALEELIIQTTSISTKENYKPKMVTDRDNGILRYEKLYFNFS